MRRIISVLMLLSMLISSLSAMHVAAEEPKELTTDDKGKILKQLEILKGNGSDYQLNDQLRRSEATAFIVRFVGKESEVMSNKQSLCTTKYDDVNTDDWFAPYVGYCSQVGIINGVSDNKFAPNDYVSEKAFLKMVITAMGYEYEKDFSWMTVYSFAKALNLVKDASYVDNKEDDLNYLRRTVVEMLFNGLKLENQTNGKVMIQYFIDEGMISPEDAGKAGIIEYEAPIAFELLSLKTLDDKTIELLFSKKMDILTAQLTGNYFLTDTMNRPIRVYYADMKDDHTGVILTTEKKISNGTKYHLTLQRLSDTKQTQFIVNEKLEFTALYNLNPINEIESIKAVDNSSIEITFIRALDEASAINVANYQVYDSVYRKTVKPKVVYFDKNTAPKTVRLYFGDTLTMFGGREYNVTVLSGLKDEKGKVQSSNLSKKINADSIPMDWTYIESAKYIGDCTVEIIFNKAISQDSPNVFEYNYELHYDDNGEEKTMKARSAMYINPMRIKLWFSEIDSSVDYYVDYDKLVDYAGKITNNEFGNFKTELVFE